VISIFHLSLIIFDFDAALKMSNDKWKMTNGKWKI